MKESTLQRDFRLGKGEVHIWKVPLSLHGDVVNHLENLLDGEERAKGHRLRFEKDRLRHVIARGALRSILAAYLDVPPQGVRFQTGKWGKPSIVCPSWGRTLHFNLSHCEDMAIMAFARGRSVGIDIEKERVVPELEAILGSYFSREEQHFVESARQERIKAFLKVWTRREATAKARGLDLSAALSDLAIPADLPEGGIRLGHLADSETSSAIGRHAWHLMDLQIDPVHAGAICVEGPRCTMTYHDFEECLLGTSLR
jgi:4'-phosphopantetheinyl transferase